MSTEEMQEDAAGTAEDTPPPDRSLLLRTLIAMLLAGLAGACLGELLAQVPLVATGEGDFTKYVKSVAAAEQLEQLAALRAERAWRLTAMPLIYGAAALLLTLLLPALFYTRCGRAGLSGVRGWATYGLRLLLLCALGGGVALLIEPMSSGGTPEAPLLMALIVGATFVIVGERALAARWSRLRRWRQIGAWELLKSFGLGALCGGVLYGAMRLHLDSSGIRAPADAVEGLLRYTLVWAGMVESPRYLQAIEAVRISVVLLLGLGAAFAAGLWVALSPTRAGWRQRIASVVLACAAAGGLIGFEVWAGQSGRVAGTRRPWPADNCGTLECAARLDPVTRHGAVATPLASAAWKVLWPTPDGLRAMSYSLKVTAETMVDSEFVLASNKNVRRLEGLLRGKQWNRYTALALAARTQALARLWRPGEALGARLDDAKRTGSILATEVAVTQAQAMPLSAAVRAACATLLDERRFVAQGRGRRRLARLAGRLGHNKRASALRAAARRAGDKAATDWDLALPWQRGELRGCVTTRAGALGGARVGLFRVVRPLYLSRQGPVPWGSPVAAGSTDPRGCFRFSGLLQSEYIVGIRLDTSRTLRGSAVKMIRAQGDLGPVLVTPARPSADLGQIGISMDAAPPPGPCPAGHVQRGGGCKRGCGDGQVLMAGHCCWPGQRWTGGSQGGCEGAVRCPARMVAIAGGGSCAPTLPPIPLPGGHAPSPPRAGGNGRDDAPMVVVPAGEFLRGSGRGAPMLDEVPQRRIHLDSFLIDKYAVTVRRYRACVAAGRCGPPSEANRRNQNHAHCNWGRGGREDHPVNCVDQQQAWGYCLWAGKRLPTEAEWEKAARGTDGRTYPWGEAAPDCARVAFFRGKATGLSAVDFLVRPTRRYCQLGTSPARARAGAASPYGAVQMTGNVWEWVADWYDGRYYATSPARNPAGPPANQLAVTRGGSWLDAAAEIHTALRFPQKSSTRRSTLGFRCAADGPPAPASAPAK